MMKKTILALSIAIPFISSIPVQAELIQHTDQIAEIQFTGSSYELGKHVGKVAKDQILEGIDRFNNLLGVMLPGLNVISLSKSFDGQNIFEKLQSSSPDAAAYIKGLADSLNRSPNLLLAVGMSDEAILESQRNGGIGFLQSDKLMHDPAAPAKCTTMGISNARGMAWGQANFDYMAINYEGLIVLNHTDEQGKTRIIQTWAGLIPYGGISKGGQAILMNTMADEGSARQNAQGEILSAKAAPSYYLSWEVYNIEQAKDLIDTFNKYPKYTAYFTYTVVNANQQVMTIENNFGEKVNHSFSDRQAHANHSLFIAKDFVDTKFAALSLARQKAADNFMKTATLNTPKETVQKFAESNPLWKGRGEIMGTVTSTYFKINNSNVDMYIRTDSDHPEVHIKNY